MLSIGCEFSLMKYKNNDPIIVEYFKSYESIVKLNILIVEN